MNNKKVLISVWTLFLLIASFVFVLIIASFFNIFSREDIETKKPTPSVSQQSPSPLPTIIPRDVRTLPTFPPQEGKGVDVTAPAVEVSKREIRKLSLYLPYVEDYTLSTGEEVTVTIPARQFQDASWVLDIDISGLNYHSRPSDPDYDRMKASFKEAAARVLNWIKENGADPRVMYISWGDRKYVQDRAEEWLLEI